tara:strand:- start:1196 stop:1465 length:270 start_codon:yes stop_codon:yes gene_type:complete
MALFGTQNKAAFDKWSLVHFATGLIASKTKLVSFPQWVILHTASEIIENSKEGKSLWRKLGWSRYEGDSLTNIAGDTASTMAGFLYGKV